MATAFGKYSLQRKLAEGGMAEVFLARQGGLEGFEKVVVLKRILPALSREQEFVKMFLNEARVAARLNHPNIVQIWDLGKIDDLYFMAMEFVHGEDLRELAQLAEERRARPAPGLICRIMADTLAGLHYAHTRVGTDGKHLGLVHRDVSPQNILVTYEGGVKLVDFGIAKATRATSEQTQAGLFKGKFAYMAPEQTRGKDVDARTDVFSVGILLWELLTWRRLFKRGSDMATLIAVSEDSIPAPRTVDSSVPVELDRIVMKALERPLERRYQSALEMRADLEALIRKQGWEADGLALGRFMRELFEDKLRQQEADIRAAGLASLEDFLLQVEERTRITWMEPRQSTEKKTPSVGLPTAPGVPPPPPAQPPPPPRLMPSAQPVPTMYDESRPTAVDDIPSKPTVVTGQHDLPPPRPPAPPMRPPIPQVQLPDPPPGPAVVYSDGDTTAASYHDGATVAARPGHAAQSSTAKSPALVAPPPRSYRRVIVIAAVALAAGVAMVLLLWK